MEKKASLNPKNITISDEPNYRYKPGAREDRKKKTLSEKKNTSADNSLRPSTTHATTEFEVLLKKKKTAVHSNPYPVK